MTDERSDSKPIPRKFRMLVSQNPKDRNEDLVRIFLDEVEITNAVSCRVVARAPGELVRVVLELIPDEIVVEGEVRSVEKDDA